MTKKNKIAWALMTPFLIAIVGGVILTTYTGITEQPCTTLCVTVVVAFLVGSYILTYDPEDIGNE